MRTPVISGAAAALAILAISGCTSPSTTPTTSSPAASSAAASSPAASSPAASSAAPSSASTPVTGADPLKVADSPLGKIIVDKSGLTAYYFTKDTANSGKSVCAGPCLVAWPAIVTTGAKPSGKGITAKLGTITRDEDGAKQVTVNGLPIYLYVKDTAPGDIKGQGVGKVWYVIAPDGKMITTAV